MRYAFALAFLALATVPAKAQSYYYGNDYINQQRLGGYTYYNGSVGNQPFSGTSQQLGNYGYSTFQSGDRTMSCTSQRLGNQTFTNCY